MDVDFTESLWFINFPCPFLTGTPALLQAGLDTQNASTTFYYSSHLF